MALRFCLLLPLLIFFFVVILPAAANTEKVIFTAPEPINNNNHPRRPALDDLNLHLLAPNSSSIRTNLTRVFPTEPGNTATGAATWYLLDHLTPGQRYELRVCWAAVQPTGFALNVYKLNTVWDTPELIQSLTGYANSRLNGPGEGQEPAPRQQGEQKSSILLLQVRASADYFTDDSALMKNPPPVLADLILDPYLYNAIPHSLLPTIGYIVVVGLVAWFAAQSVSSKLQSIAFTNERTTKKHN